ncbi:MAG: Gfo/Idh/MocA family oxidoreductase [Bryobacterales bacterium]|nr:Gfo/Idh/MocA family oxidoreductase [Bryobacterales bacterium]
MSATPQVRRAAGASALTALSASRIIGANDRIGIALIGCGGRGRLVASLVLKAPNVEYRVLCDVYEERTGQASQQLAGGKGQSARDFRKVLEQKDIDAVHVATPDHWHAAQVVLALQAGKDVYVEKPVSRTFREGQAIVAASRRYKDRIVMAGTQHRSAPHYAEAAKIVQSGEIGDVYYVRIWNSGNNTPPTPPVPDSTPPGGLDWDFYVGPAPYAPFNLHRLNYRQWYDYASGYITDYGNHRVDSFYQMMNCSWPLTISGSGRKFVKENFGDIYDVMNVVYEYPNFVMTYTADWTNSHGMGGGRTPGMSYYGMTGPFNRPHAEAFFGTKGTLITDRIGYEVYPEVDPSSTGRGARGAGAQPEVRFRSERKQVQGADRTDLHALNWIEAIRSRKQPFANIELGHLATGTCLLGNIAIQAGRKLRFDGKKQEIIGDPEATRLMTREQRTPWNLIKV